MILATEDGKREAALAQLLPMQQSDFEAIFAAMEGLPVTVRLLDPPLHEFLPDRTALAVELALTAPGPERRNLERLAERVRQLSEQNPMLGTRGCRLALLHPGIYAMQVRAIVRGALAAAGRGEAAQVEIMIPLVAFAEELRRMRALVEEVVAEELERAGRELEISIGTMIELPRAALTAGQIAEAAQFFSFGTNDLTQMGWGFSRDDVEGSFFSKYIEMGIFGVSPFETLDTDGIGRLVQIAVEEGRQTRADLKIGVCGEHGGDPESVHFFHEAGLDYVSCSPFRVPVARLEAGRAVALAETGGSDSR
jgi:pyruvate, orthophosphate dikinase